MAKTLEGVQDIKVVTNNLPPEIDRAAKDIKVSEDLYTKGAARGLSLTSMLEELDPSKPGDMMNAFERQLCKQGIRVQGPAVDAVERFFQTYEDKILFPEFIAKQVQVGKEKVGQLSDIVALRTKIDSTEYKSMWMDDDVAGNKEENRRLVRVTEYADMPGVKLKTAETAIKIYKYGRYIQTSYEFLRRQKIDVVALFFQAMGMQIQKDKFAAAMNVLVNGDGNSNAAAITNWTGSTIAYKDLVSFKLAFEDDAFNLSYMIAPLATAVDVYDLDRFNNALVSGLDAAKSGAMPKPLNVPLVSDLSHTLPANTILGIDKSMAIQEVYETELLTETEQVIRSQFNGTAVSEVVGYAKLLPKATRLLQKA